MHSACLCVLRGSAAGGAGMHACMPMAAMVLFFMFSASWRLTVVTFILIPIVLLISEVRRRPAGRPGNQMGACDWSHGPPVDEP
jgi:hypothetical protein